MAENAVNPSTMVAEPTTLDVTEHVAALGATHPRVKLDDIRAEIESVHYCRTGRQGGQLA